MDDQTHLNPRWHAGLRDLLRLCFFLARDLLLQLVRWAALALKKDPAFVVEIHAKRGRFLKSCFWLELAIIAPAQALRIGTSEWRGIYDSTLLYPVEPGGGTTSARTQ